MLGLLIILVISWALLRFVEKKNIDVLGIIPSLNRLSQLVLGFLIITLITLINIYVETQVLNVSWKSKAIDYAMFLNAFIYHLKSALTEDLIFRGAMLYVLIQRIGAVKAIWLSAIVFGVYHWFSYGIIEGRLILLAYVLVVTGFTGYVWAYTFYKTKSIMTGLGFHLGVNLINACFFESQPYGEILFQKVSSIDVNDWNWLFFNLFKGLFPSIATLVCLKFLLKTKLYSQTENTQS
ncbi:CPBP family intramembrane glutamic endopeptidase [Meridianimaribacter flavus]|uniref:CAAX prenyl protease 2/Lysostaphin resistance protein A-like domain-containing protein n=1 Tax=Meridianimaribacter flavus TaxID=571115 RepID=A0ABY2GAE2_9FLAO|nr:CPBP family intramembrane glutamic endopeptidase [Meridianimaribacter flavus]TDY14353.1 hypothetical protein A8975_0964 [Meridianimaribacter flavus]